LAGAGFFAGAAGFAAGAGAAGCCAKAVPAVSATVAATLRLKNVATTASVRLAGCAGADAFK
jgi:hypothetical protein